MFKYKIVINHLHFYPWTSTTYSIKNKTQLSPQETEKIVEMINSIEDTIEWDVVVNYKGEKKYMNSYQINQIFEQYNMKI